MKDRKRTIAIAGIALAVLSLALFAAVVWRVERTLKGSLQASLATDELAVETLPVVPAPNPGFELISAPSVFQSGASFDGYFYLSGPAGLYAYTEDGALARLYRTGIDLPPAPLGQMAVGTLTDSHRPELVIATSGAGVLVFDGSHFRNIHASDSEARKVTAVLPLSSGRLLLGTAKLGVLVYDGKTLKRFHPTTNDIYVTALAGTEADLWIGTLNSGVFHWRGGQTEHIGEAEGLPDSRVEAIAIDREQVYVGTPVGVADFHQGKLIRTLANGRYAHSLFVEGNTLLIGQEEDGILPLSLAGQGTATTGRRAIGVLGEDSNHASAAGQTVEQFLSVEGHPYAVLQSGLLRRESGGDWRKILSPGGALLSDRNVSALMAASDGHLWVGYFDRGLDILSTDGEKAKHLEDEHVFCVNRILEDRQRSSIAVATANGMVLFDKNEQQKQVLTRQSGLIADHVTDVVPYNDGLALATPAGVTFLDKSGAHSIYAFQGLVNNHVYALGVHGSQLLVGTLGGLSLLNGDSVQRNFTTANSGLNHNWITGVVPVGDQWLVGTYGAGILRVMPNGEIDRTEATENGVVINPTAMFSDGQRILAGTLGQGLLVSDANGSRWKKITAGLPSLNVTALAVANGMVYVGTENGLVKIQENKL